MLPRSMAPLGRVARTCSPTSEEWLELERRCGQELDRSVREAIVRACDGFLLRFSQSRAAVPHQAIRARSRRLLSALTELKAALTGDGSGPAASVERQAHDREFSLISQSMVKHLPGESLTLSQLRAFIDPYAQVCARAVDLHEAGDLTSAVDQDAASTSFLIGALLDVFEEASLSVTARNDTTGREGELSAFPQFVWALWCMLPERCTRPVSSSAMNTQIAKVRAARTKWRERKDPGLGCP